MDLLPFLGGIDVIIAILCLFNPLFLSFTLGYIAGGAFVSSYVAVYLSGSVLLFAFTFTIGGIFGAVAIISLLSVLSGVISRLGVYHVLGDDNPEVGEPFRAKYLKVLWCNIILAIPLLATVISVINPSPDLLVPGAPLNGADCAFLVAFMIIPATLLSFRVLANPTKKNILRIPQLTEILKYYSHPNAKRARIYEIKERFMSFYISLIGASLFFLFLNFMYKTMSAGGSDSSILMENYFPKMPVLALGLLLLAEILAMMATTFIGEIILAKLEPIEQIEL